MHSPDATHADECHAQDHVLKASVCALSAFDVKASQFRQCSDESAARVDEASGLQPRRWLACDSRVDIRWRSVRRDGFSRSPFGRAGPLSVAKGDHMPAINGRFKKVLVKAGVFALVLGSVLGP